MEKIKGLEVELSETKNHNYIIKHEYMDVSVKFLVFSNKKGVLIGQNILRSEYTYLSIEYWHTVREISDIIDLLVVRENEGK